MKYLLFFTVPQSAPDGLKLLLHQCWCFKPRNRPSFSQILKHLEIVSGTEVLLKIDDDYFKSQISWKEEIQEKMSLKQIDVSNIKLYNNLEDDLIQKRKEELKHATDIRELYEQKLEKANNLYFELSTVLVQLDQRERDLIKREKEFSIKNEKIVRPILKVDFDDYFIYYNFFKLINYHFIVKREFQDRTKSYINNNAITKNTNDRENESNLTADKNENAIQMVADAVENENSDKKNEANINENIKTSDSNVEEDHSTVNNSESFDDLNTANNTVVQSENYKSTNTKSKLF